MTDLHLTSDRPTAVERDAVDRIVPPGESAVIIETERLVRGGRARRASRRHLLLPALHALHHHAGWISPGGLNHVAERLQVPPAEAYGVATFYELFRTEPPDQAGATHHVCSDAACQIADADDLVSQLVAAGHRVHRSPCLGQCERAPARFVQGVGEPDHVPADSDPFTLPQSGDPDLRLLARVGVADPTSLDSYRDHGGYRALARAKDLGPDAVIDAITDAGLSGRGGAAFPTGHKWRAVADQPHATKYVVANGDESEPGTFKDRVLMDHDPFALIEALTIAGLATGASTGWIYLRGEYPLAAVRLTGAIEQSRAAGLLGPDALGPARPFDIELRRGAGAYVCGEETALFNSIEGFRGEPRNKPPYPTTDGLFGAPTAVNNPETLSNVLDIVLDGADTYRSVGTGDSPGTKLFCLSGHVDRPGVYEVPFGTSLGSLIDRAGGSLTSLQAVLLGGAAGRFVEPDRLDLPLTLEDTRAAGLSLGSGVVMVFDDTVDLGPVVTRIAEFFRNESCGQCVPCRVGTVRQLELLTAGGQQDTGLLDTGLLDTALLDDIARVMADASICGLGHTASTAVRSAIDLGLIGPPR